MIEFAHKPDLPPRPPLWTWPAAFVLAGAMFLALVLLDRPAQWRYFALDRLGPPSESVKQDLIVAIGTSKTRCALDYDSDMDATLRAADIPAHFVRISHSAATIDDLDIVFDQLEKAKPKLVFVESDLLLYEPQIYRPTAEPYKAPDIRQHIQATLTHIFTETYQRLIGNFDTKAVYLENTPYSRDGCYHPDSGSLDRYFQLLNTRRASTAPERQRYLDRFSKLHALGVTIALLDLPRRPMTIGYFPPKLAADAAVARQAVLQSGLVTEAGRPPDLSDADFFDAGHLKASGRSIFSYWLVDRLPSLLRAASHG